MDEDAETVESAFRSLLNKVQNLLAKETRHHQYLDERVKDLSQGSDYVYRNMMILIAVSRAFGQLDGIDQLMLKPDFSDIDSVKEAVSLMQRTKVQNAINNVEAEIRDLQEKSERLDEDRG